MKVAIYARLSSEAQAARGTIGSQLEVYQPEADVVRRIFAEYLEEISLRQIARHRTKTAS